LRGGEKSEPFREKKQLGKTRGKKIQTVLVEDGKTSTLGEMDLSRELKERGYRKDTSKEEKKKRALVGGKKRCL